MIDSKKKLKCNLMSFYLAKEKPGKEKFNTIIRWSPDPSNGMKRHILIHDTFNQRKLLKSEVPMVTTYT